MKNKLLICTAVIFAFSVSIQSVWAQQTREQRTITGNYNDTATIAPTIARVKSLKLPAGFPLPNLPKSKIREC